MSKKPMAVQGFDWDAAHSEMEATSKTINKEMPYSSNISSTPGEEEYLGMPITVTAFNEMRKKYYQAMLHEQSLKPLGNILYVVFSKASLFRVLSQEGVESLCFWFCLPYADQTRMSLCVEGFDKDFLPVGEQQILANAQGTTPQPSNPQDPFLEERGHGGSTTSGASVRENEESFSLYDLWKNAPGFLDLKSFREFMNRTYEKIQAACKPTK